MEKEIVYKELITNALKYKYENITDKEIDMFIKTISIMMEE